MVPTVDRIHIGSSFGSSWLINGHIRRLTYYPARLSNALSLEVLGEGVGDRHLGHEVVGELDPMIGLDALDGEGESLTQFLEEGDGGLGGKFLGEAQQAPAAELVAGGVLVELVAPAIPQAGVLDVDLDPLSGAGHGLIGLGAASAAALGGEQPGAFEDLVEAVDPRVSPWWVRRCHQSRTRCLRQRRRR